MIDISKLDVSKELDKTENMLEFFILIISKHLHLKPKQVYLLKYKKKTIINYN